MEVWDAYNKEFEKIEGMTLIRGEAIPDGVYHLVSDVIVRHADGTYLLMQRDSRKHFGGMWEATALRQPGYISVVRWSSGLRW